MSGRRFLLCLLSATVLLGGCAGPPRKAAEAPPARSGAYYSTDGPPERIPVDLDRIADAAPREEPLHRFANRPYTVFGMTYTPMTMLRPASERGLASWYGRKFHGQRTAIGETYDMFAMTAAHPTFPLPSYARVTHVRSNRSVIVRLNDRGPFLHGRVIDLSYAAAHRLGIAQAGSGEVLVELLVPPFDDSAPSAPRIGPPSPPEPAAVPPRAEAVVAAAATATDGRFFVQLGAFGNFANANAFQARMQATLAQTPQVRQAEGLFRVQLGPFPSRAEAEAARRDAEAILGVSLPIVSSRP